MELARSARLARRRPLRRVSVSPASEEQRAKVVGERCILCRARSVELAHLVPRALGGCDEPDCVVPLCSVHHRRYNRGELDRCPISRRASAQSFSTGSVTFGLLGLLRRVTGHRWTPVAERPTNAAREA